MDHAALVGVLEGVGDLRGQFELRTHGKLRVGDVLNQGLASDEFHGEVGLLEGHPGRGGRGGGTGFVDVRDAYVLELTKKCGLAAEAFHHAGRGQSGSNDLECDRALRVVLPGLVDGAHAALADEVQNLVRSQAGELAGMGGSVCVAQRCVASHRAAQKFAVTFIVEVEQRLDLGADGGVCTMFVEVRGARLRRQRGQRIE